MKINISAASLAVALALAGANQACPQNVTQHARQD